MAKVIIADSPEGQRSRVAAWLKAAGGKWTRELAMAACEGWAARVPAARAHQEAQLVGMPPATLKTTAAGDTWAVLAQCYDGRKATLGEPGEALRREVVRRMVARIADEPVTSPSAPPPSAPLPSAPPTSVPAEAPPGAPPPSAQGAADSALPLVLAVAGAGVVWLLMR